MSTIDLSPLIGQILPMVATLIFGFLAKIIHDVNMRNIIHRGLEMAVNYAVQQSEKADWTKIETRNELVAAGANYAISHFPSALKYFGVNRIKLEQLVMARLVNFDNNIGVWEQAKPDAPSAVDIAPNFSAGGN